MGQPVLLLWCILASHSCTTKLFSAWCNLLLCCYAWRPRRAFLFYRLRRLFYKVFWLCTYYCEVRRLRRAYRLHPLSLFHLSISISNSPALLEQLYIKQSTLSF